MQPATSQVREVASMRRIISLFTVATLRAVMLAVTVTPAFAAKPLKGATVSHDNDPERQRDGAGARVAHGQRHSPRPRQRRQVGPVRGARRLRCSRAADPQRRDQRVRPRRRHLRGRRMRRVALALAVAATSLVGVAGVAIAQG